MSDQKDENAEWVEFTEDLDYDKVFYDVLLPTGEIVEMCWPNNGFMNAYNNNGQKKWSGKDGVKVRPSLNHPFTASLGNPMKIKYLITYGGGVGPREWDGEMAVDAGSVREALDIAEPRINEMGGQVFSVEHAESRQ